MKPAPRAAAEPASANEGAARADRRYDEMLGKMQAAVEEIAQLYGNPVFLQVFTNDEERASQLKERLRLAKTGDDVGHELADLQKKREDLLNDIALKQREADRLTSRLVRQRAALEALSEAVDQARKAVEETTR
jgi:chromosome segregation ATPase